MKKRNKPLRTVIFSQLKFVNIVNHSLMSVTLSVLCSYVVTYISNICVFLCVQVVT